MTLTEAGPKGGGFVCVPGSHKYHQDYFKKKKMLDHKDNWFVVPEGDKGTEPLKRTLKVNSKAGDFILFDSRTFHCNTVPTEK
jgi:ectoine hydroxylase-related dioxygenase (phytanoyl-CoA dioxygenase family)